MTSEIAFDPLTRFAEIEWLVAKVYFRFSHLFLDHPQLRDFWWEMAKEEEQHGSILSACKAMIENYEERLDQSVNSQKADELEQRLLEYLRRGTPSLPVEEAFQIALEIERSELDAIYSKLVNLGGPEIAKTLQNLGVPASVQRQKLKAALRQFCSDPALLDAAERL